MVDQNCRPSWAIASFGRALHTDSLQGLRLGQVNITFAHIRNYYMSVPRKLSIRVPEEENREDKEQYQKRKWLRFSKTDKKTCIFQIKMHIASQAR